MSHVVRLNMCCWRRKSGHCSFGFLIRYFFIFSEVIFQGSLEHYFNRKRCCFFYLEEYALLEAQILSLTILSFLYKNALFLHLVIFFVLFAFQLFNACTTATKISIEKDVEFEITVLIRRFIIRSI